MDIQNIHSRIHRGKNHCDYVNVRGQTCGKHVYYDRCFPHKNRESHILCTLCAVSYTRSATGICSKGSCRKHNHRAARVKRNTPEVVTPLPDEQLAGEITEE